MKTTLSFFPFILVVQMLQAQSYTFYWQNQYGSQGVFLTGAVVASNSDYSSAIYNPAALPIVEEKGVSLSFLAGGLSNLKLEGTFLDESDIDDSGVFILPKFLAVGDIFKRTNLVFLVYHRSFPALSTTIREVDVDPEDPSLLLVENFHYDNAFNEVVAGLAYGVNIAPTFNAGVSVIFPSRSHSGSFNSRSERQSITDPVTLITSTVTDVEFNMVHTGVQFKTGLHWMPWERLKLGFTVTTPSVLSLFNSGDYSYRFVNAPDPDSPITIDETSNIDVETMVKYPWAFGAGFELNGDHWNLHFSTEHFTAIDPYVMLPDTDDPYDGLSPGYNRTPRDLSTSAKSVTNFAVAATYTINEDLRLLGGFQTDQNYYIPLEEGIDIQPISGDWNNYYLSFGVDFRLNRNRFAVGARYGFTGEQEVSTNFRPPFGDSGGMSEETKPTVRYSTLNFAVTYSFGGKE